MTAREAERRRALGRLLTRVSNAPVEEVLSGLGAAPAGPTRRIGITGPPGAGKSTLISRLARRRLDRGIAIGVLAIDPTSPVSGGSLLGDRVRMDAVAGDPRLYIRSLPSRRSHDGLCDNVADLLVAMETHGFDEVIVETVGVGQAEFDVRTLVDTLVLVVPPQSGDAVQMMKAGILEVADVYAVGKADLPGAGTAAAELLAVLRARGHGRDGGWEPPVVVASPATGRGIEELDAALDRHLDWVAQHRDPAAVRRARARQHVRNLVGRRVAEVVDAAADEVFDGGLGEAYHRVLERLSPSGPVLAAVEPFGPARAPADRREDIEAGSV